MQQSVIDNTYCENGARTALMINTQITISNHNDLKKRSYIYIKIGDKKYKEYTGVKLGLDIQPNSCLTVKDRIEKLKVLEYEFKKAIEFGKYPLDKSLTKIKTIENTTLRELLEMAIDNKKKANLSTKYVHHLEKLTNKLKAFLTSEELNGNINDLQRSRIQEFMNQFNSSTKLLRKLSIC